MPPINGCVSLIAAASIVGTLITGCSSASSGSVVDPDTCATGDVTLSVAAPPTADNSLKVAVDAFEAQHEEVSVETRPLAGSSYNEYAQQIIGDLAAGVQIDVVNIGHDQIPLFVHSYDVRPFDTSLLHDSYDESFLPVGVIDGEQYAIPFQVSVAGLYRNTDALADVGIDTDAPLTSLADVIEQAEAYTEATGSPAMVTDRGVGGDDWYSQMFTQSLGGEFIKDGMPVFDNEAGIEAFSFYGTGAETGFLNRGEAKDVIGNFVTGVTPMVMISTSAVPIFASQVQDAFTWDLQAFPASEEPRYVAGGNSWLSIAEDDCRAALGQAFIAEVVGADALLPSLTGYGYFPVDEDARAVLVQDTTTDPRSVALYEGDDLVMTPFGGWPGSSTPEVQRAIADMVDRIMAGANVADEVASTQEQIERIVG